jgi:hypothetical protein
MTSPTPAPPNLDARLAGLRMTVSGLFLALLAVTAVTAFSARQLARPILPEPAIAYVLAGIGGILLVAYFATFPRAVQRFRTEGGYDAFAAETFVRAGLLAGAGAFCAAAYLLTRDWIVLAPATAFTVLLVGRMPTKARYEKWESESQKLN